MPAAFTGVAPAGGSISAATAVMRPSSISTEPCGRSGMSSSIVTTRPPWMRMVSVIIDPFRCWSGRGLGCCEPAVELFCPGTDECELAVVLHAGEGLVEQFLGRPGEVYGLAERLGHVPR